MTTSDTFHPYLGFGLGLRVEHYETIVQEKPKTIDWFEILTENYMVPGGKPLYYLDKIRQDYPMVMHGVSLSLGSKDPLDWSYLKQLKQLMNRVEPVWISDHLCWTGVHGKNTHDLLPLPYTEEAITEVVNKITQIQNYLGQRILIENTSSYVTYQQSVMPEWEFLTAIVERADCLILLDINNIYVSAYNHHFDANVYLDNVPSERVTQIHLAGHTNCGEHIIDTHSASIIDPVWKLYTNAIQRFGSISTMIERDDNIPSLSELMDELTIARKLANDVLTGVAA